MNITNALLIEGAMDPSDLEWLAVHASKSKHIVEIGSWMGRSTMVLADNTDGVVFAVDTWKGSEEHQSFLADKPVDFVYGVFCKNLKAHIDNEKVCPFRFLSVEAAQVFQAKGYSFDMVFIDASHDYENVKADILAWKPLVKGLLCGHDYSCPSVAQVVRELIPNAVGECNMWCVELK